MENMGERLCRNCKDFLWDQGKERAETACGAVSLSGSDRHCRNAGACHLNILRDWR